MGLFDLFKRKTDTPNKGSTPTDSVKMTGTSPKIDRCVQCKSTLPANVMNEAKLNQNISWEIKGDILYLYGNGVLTEDDYLTITAPAPRYNTITYNRVLPWSVCPCIREGNYISETCPVQRIPTHIKKLVVNGEISGLKDFLLNSCDWIGVRLQSAKEYFDF